MCAECLACFGLLLNVWLCFHLSSGTMRSCGEPVGAHIAAGTFPGTFYHSSLFFSTHELTYGYSAVSSATALSQVRRRVSA